MKPLKVLEVLGRRKYDKILGVWHVRVSTWIGIVTLTVRTREEAFNIKKGYEFLN